MSRGGRAWLPWVLGAVGTCGAIVAIGLSLDTGQAFRQIVQLDPASLIPGLAAIAVQLLIRAARWSRLLSAVAGRRIPVRRVIDPLLVGYLGNNALPSRAGEAIRAVLVARRERLGVGEVGATVVTERVIDFATLVVLGAVAVWLATGVTSGGIVVAAGGVAALLVARLLARAANARGWWERAPSNRAVAVVLALFRTLGGLPLPTLLACGALSLAAWACDAVVMLSVANAIGVEISLPAAIAVGAGAVIGTAAPAGPGYVGTFELGALAGGASAGLAAETVLPIAILAHVLGLVPLSIAGAVAAARLGAERWRDTGRSAYPEAAAHAAAPEATAQG